MVNVAQGLADMYIFKLAYCLALSPIVTMRMLSGIARGDFTVRNFPTLSRSI
ncbi:unnamed protein product [Penicillium camemberti]|uniref:Str. FM013 n=1 Tax=Penicillium camemberti (strain FM 013) TaxID=1429867 RepID=A0A0G4PSH0_PENC3|nr:unnamed protein product [Penicillium camemberti]